MGIVVGVAIGMTLGPVLFKSALGGTPLKTLPDPPLATGEVRVEPTGKGFSLVLPKGWISIDPNSNLFQSAMKEGLAQSPSLKSVAQKVDWSKFSSYAIEIRSADAPLPRTVNVVRNESGHPLRDPAGAAKQLADGLKEQLPTVQVLETGAAKLPIGDVPRVVASLPLTDATGKAQATTTVSYLFSSEGKSFNLTVTGKIDDRAEVVQLAEKVATSFRVKD